MESSSTLGSSKEYDCKSIDLLLLSEKKLKESRSNFITEIYLCGSCYQIYYSMDAVYEHFRFGDHGGRKKVLTEEDAKSQKIAADSRKKKVMKELREDCNLHQFLTWFLASVFINRKPKYISDWLFNRLRSEKLLGAPIDCPVNDFLLWVFNEAWDKDDIFQKEFLRKLFVPPRNDNIDWHLYWDLKSSRIKDCPFICVFEAP